MSRNGKQSPRRPRIEVRQANASPEEAAAIAAAIEQFLRDTAPAPAAAAEPPSAWQRAALFEGARIDSAGPSPWGDPEPWGSYGARRLAQHRVVDVEAPAALAARLPALTAPFEAESLPEQNGAAIGVAGIGPYAVEALERQLPRDLGVAGRQRLVAARVDHELVVEALRVG